MGRFLSRRAVRAQEQLFFWAVAATVALAVVLPLAVLTGQLAAGDPAQRHSVLATLATPSLWLLLARSVGLAIAVTALSLTVGVPIGFLLSRTDVPGRRSAFLLHAFPMFLPPFAMALGWFHILGRNGAFGSESTSRFFFGESGLLLVLGATFTPIASTMVALGVRGIDPALEEAARLVAPPGAWKWPLATRIVLPLARPAIALAALVVFTLSFSELGVPMFLRVKAYPAVVFSRLGGIDFQPGEAFALVLPLLAISALVLAGERRWAARRSFSVLGLRSGESPLWELGRARAPATTLCWLAVAVSIAPIASLALRAARGQGFSSLGDWAGAGLVNSLSVSGLAAIAIAILGVVLGHALARGLKGAALVDAVTVLAFVTPAAVLGVGLIATWNRPATDWVYRGRAILVIALVARYTAIGARTIAVAMAQGSPHLEEAAAAFGA
ncbi:MAG: iron ABC transporter permease, partial [Candidatus Wallbacteria bacterium]|nr:iron ABC transporter permease [Candidatus Wallbacteria bacterium]